MKKTCKLIIILAILITPVNFVLAVPAAPMAVCQIKARVLNAQRTEVQTLSIGLESRLVKFYQVDLQVDSATAEPNQELNDCSYLGTNPSVKYSLDNYSAQPIVKDQEITASVQLQGDERFNGIMLWNVKLAGQPEQAADFISQKIENFTITSAEAGAGKKFRAFDKNFVFDIEAETFSVAASLELKEMILAPGSRLQPPVGMQLASRVYQFDLKTVNPVKFAQDFWFSVKYDDTDYFRKNLYYFDYVKNKWLGLESIISDGASKIIAHYPGTYLQVAILEDITIMTEGTASWYKYKGCNCAASPDYPKGTKLKVTNVKNNKSIIVKVNDWGPDRSIFPNRVIDLDVVAFKKIANKSAGVCQVKVELAEPDVSAAAQK